MSELEPITREEVLLNAIAEGAGSDLEPITRQEIYLSAIAGETDLPSDMSPITREEIYYQKILDNGGTGGGEAEGTVQITSNGTHNVKQYASAQVNVQNSYSASDEGKVVSNGALTAQTSRTVTSNGTIDTTLNDEVTVNVPTGITPTGSQTFTENGTYDVTSLAEAVVNVASSGGRVTAIEVTLTSDAVTTQGLVTALKTATGFTNIIAFNISDTLRTTGYVTYILPIGNYRSDFTLNTQVYRLNNGSTGWGNYATSSTTVAESGEKFLVIDMDTIMP